MRMIIVRFQRVTDGATAIEYGLIAGLIAVAIIAGASTLGGSLNDNFNYIANKVASSAP